jgi:ribosomal-protein-alanine N-acetyltransferase
MAGNPIRQVPIDTILETARCLLRYPILSDVPRAFSAFTSAPFPTYVPLGQISSIEEVEAWIVGAQSRWSEGGAFTWSVDQKRDRLLMGQVTLTKIPDSGAWALAFWTHPECWGEGYATEAAGRVIEFAFRDLGATRIWAGAAEWNKGSLRVLEKLGMVHLSDNPEGYAINGAPIPTQEFEITLSIWQNPGADSINQSSHQSG